jgi:hypothetical protein
MRNPRRETLHRLIAVMVVIAVALRAAPASAARLQSSPLPETNDAAGHGTRGELDAVVWLCPGGGVLMYPCRVQRRTAPG